MSWCICGLFEPFEHLWRVCSLILNVISWFRPSYHLAGAFPLPLDVGYLPKVAPAPRSRLSSTYHLDGASLPLDMGYLLKVIPALFNCCSSLRLDSVKSHPCEVPQSPSSSWSKDCWSWGDQKWSIRNDWNPTDRVLTRVQFYSYKHLTNFILLTFLCCQYVPKWWLS